MLLNCIKSQLIILQHDITSLYQIEFKQQTTSQASNVSHFVFDEFSIVTKLI